MYAMKIPLAATKPYVPSAPNVTINITSASGRTPRRGEHLAQGGTFEQSCDIIIRKNTRPARTARRPGKARPDPHPNPDGPFVKFF